MSDAPVTTEPSTVPEIRARVRIRYCTQCRWLMRAQWLAGELLTTFPLELEVTLEPGIGGIFDVLLEDELIFSRAARRAPPLPGTQRAEAKNPRRHRPRPPLGP